VKTIILIGFIKYLATCFFALKLIRIKDKSLILKLAVILLLVSYTLMGFSNVIQDGALILTKLGTYIEVIAVILILRQAVYGRNDIA